MDEMFFVTAPAKKVRRHKEPDATQIDVWASSGASEKEAEIQLLIPIARRLAREAGTEGCTIADVREEASRRGILPPLGKGRSLAFLGSLMKRAGLVATDRTRRSHIEGSNGNRQTVHLSPEFAG